MSLQTPWVEATLDRGWVPDRLVRSGIRKYCEQRLLEAQSDGIARKMALIEEMGRQPIVLEAGEATRDFELPSGFFQLVLGPRLKFSGCYWPENVTTLAEAEECSLDQVVWRARLANGQRILDLGCGWGSLSLYLADRFPECRITGVAACPAQKAFIDGEIQRRSLQNLSIAVANPGGFQPEDGGFDRVVSIETFEQMRNWEAMLQRVAAWTAPGGLLFVQLCAHNRFAYPFEVGGSDRMAERFLGGCIMPSDDLMLHFQNCWQVCRHWAWSGAHYHRTAEAWLANLDRNRKAAVAEFKRVFGSAAVRWLTRWRVFLMTCAEMFGYAGGSEWCVSHYLMEKR